MTSHPSITRLRSLPGYSMKSDRERKAALDALLAEVEG